MKLVVTVPETYFVDEQGERQRAGHGSEVDVPEKQARKLIRLGVARPASEKAQPAVPVASADAEKPAAKLASKPAEQPPGQ